MPQVTKRGNYYYVGDRKLVRVSSILDVIAKPALIPWAARKAAEILLAEPPERIHGYTPDEIANRVFVRRDDAARIGTDVHDVLHSFANGAKIDLGKLRPEIQGYVAAGLSFYNTLNYKQILFAEVACYSETYGYGGTIDVILQLADDSIWLYDFKTGGIYKEAALQEAAYKHAALEMKLLERIDHTAVVQLFPNGEFVVKTTNEPFEVFLHAKALYEWVINSLF